MFDQTELISHTYSFTDIKRAMEEVAKNPSDLIKAVVTNYRDKLPSASNRVILDNACFLRQTYFDPSMPHPIPLRLSPIRNNRCLQVTEGFL